MKSGDKQASGHILPLIFFIPVWKINSEVSEVFVVHTAEIFGLAAFFVQFRNLRFLFQGGVASAKRNR